MSGNSDAASDVGEVEPDFDAAEVRAFGADGRRDADTKIAGRTNIASEFGLKLAELSDFLHRGLVDFFLGVEAGAHRPFVMKMEKRAGFIETDGFGVGEKIKSDLRRNAAVEKMVLGGPSVLHGALVDFLGAGIVGEKHGRDVVGLAGVGESKKRTRARDHAMALVLAVCGVADSFGKRVIGVLESTHHRGVDADVECFEAIEIAGGI